MYPNHEKDVYGWAIHTAQLLREKKMNEVDFDNIIEEMEALGRSEKHELINRVSLVISHLLKWQFQPDFRGRSWHGTIKEQRKRAKMIIKENPSLKSKVEEVLIDAYDIALSLIEKETPIDLKLLPSQCPYTFEQIMNDEFYPE